MSRKTKSISFDLTDGHEKRLLEYVENEERGKFSRYIKRLIANDMESRQVRSVVSVATSVTKEKDDGSIEGFL